MTRLSPAKPPGDMLEREFEAQLVGTRTNPGLARMLGWRCYHVLRSRGSEPGYPDWTLVRDRVVWVECKTERGRVSQEQKEWILALLKAGGEAYLARPTDLDDLAVVLAARTERRTSVYVVTRQQLEQRTLEAVQ